MKFDGAYLLLNSFGLMSLPKEEYWIAVADFNVGWVPAGKAGHLVFSSTVQS